MAGPYSAAEGRWDLDAEGGPRWDAEQPAPLWKHYPCDDGDEVLVPVKEGIGVIDHRVLRPGRWQ